MRKRNPGFQVLLIAMTLLLAACNPAPGNTTEGKVTPEEAKSIAREAFLWGMHPGKHSEGKVPWRR